MPRSAPKATRWRRHAAVLVLIAGASFPALAAPTLESVRAGMAQTEVLRGGFESTRHVAGLKDPLRSTGRFVLARGQGLLWRQEAPFPVSFTVTPLFLRQQVQGAAPRTLQAAENPAAALLGNVLLAVFSGVPPGGEDGFATRFEVLSETAWRLALTPTHPPLNGMFRTVRVTGARWIEQIELVNTQGDRTVIRFHDVSASPVELSDEERTAFQP